nr:putative ribonuclease H-like domain-containing protein [Tanacetum cinerariifolium]
MRTRSQSRHNSPQQEALPVIVEPLRIELPFLEDQFQEDPPPEVPMADNRTMAELLQAPTEGYEDAIVIPEIAVNNFELKNGGSPDLACKRTPRSILTWDDLVSKFINKFFPPSKTTNLRNEITRFQQRFDESFYEAWDRFNDLLSACPHHGFSELHQLNTFYNALNVNDHDSLNSAAGGNFLDKMPRECLKIIESKSKVRQSRAKAVVAKVSTSSSTPAISSEVAELKDLVRALLLDKKNQSSTPVSSPTPAPVKAVEPNCVTCGEAVATACFTQNRSIICLHHGKTPYELMHGKQPDLSFFLVFSALCYPTNDSENVGDVGNKMHKAFPLPDGQDAVWRNQNTIYGQALVKGWKLLTSCGVHIITLTTTNIILLVERRYPLSKFTLEQLVNATRLQVEEERIKREFSVARTPQQNEVAERKSKTLIEAARTMLADSLLPIPFWAEAVNTACYVQNRVLVIKPYNKTPCELLIGIGPKWLFDIDTLTMSMNYHLVVTGNQPNDNADPQNIDKDAAFDVKENENDVHVFANGSDKTGNKKHDEKAKRDNKGKSHVDSPTGVRDLRAKFEEFSFNSTNGVNVVSAPVNAAEPNLTNSTNSLNTASPSVNAISLNFEIAGKSSFVDPSKYPNDTDMPELEDIVYSDDEEDVGTEADLSYLETNMPVSPILTTRNHKDHPVNQIIGDLNLAPQTRSMIRMVKEQDLPKGKRAIGSKWVFRKKNDKRGIVIRNKAKLVAQGHAQEEGIDYDEVFAHVVRIKAIWLFLAYASFMGFMVYQMNVKSAFLYGTIKEEVYVCQPLGFEDPDYPNKVYKVVKALYELHQAPRAWYETLATYLLENGFQRGKIDQTLFKKKQKGDILLV